MRVLAVDPGGTTGFTFWQGSDSPTDAEFRTWMDDDPHRVCDTVYDMLYAGLDAVVCENFVIGAGTIKKSRKGSNTAIEIIGALRWLTTRWRCPYALQMPGDVTYIDDAKLKRMGWYTPGPDHARSSTRHLVHYLLSINALDRSVLLPSTTVS